MISWAARHLDQSVFLICHLWLTTTNLSYRFPILETSTTASCETTGAYVCICLFKYACMHACMHACMYVCMYARLYVCMRECVFACLFACSFVCLSVCLPACLPVCLSVCLYVCMYACMNECMNVLWMDGWMDGCRDVLQKSIYSHATDTCKIHRHAHYNVHNTILAYAGPLGQANWDNCPCGNNPAELQFNTSMFNDSWAGTLEQRSG